MQLTNATKALIIAFLNTVLGLVVGFGVNLSDAQQGSIIAAVNAGLALLVAVTYKNSPKRVAK